MDKFSLLITQPLYQDKFLKSENEQIELYQKIIDSYLKDENIIIKTHPREKIDYNKLKSNNKIIIINDNFPIEILNFIPNLKFNKVITILSTSIKLINNCNKKIMLGWPYLYDFMNKDK